MSSEGKRKDAQEYGVSNGVRTCQKPQCLGSFEGGSLCDSDLRGRLGSADFGENFQILPYNPGILAALAQALLRIRSRARSQASEQAI